MIILDEKKFAEDCLQNGLIVLKPYYILTILAKYYYHIRGFRKKKIMELLFDYLKKYYPRYELSEFYWKTEVEKIAEKAGKNLLIEISGVKITKSEIEKIKELKNKTLERLAFVMLCLAKYHNLRNSKNNNWVNTNDAEIFKFARVICDIKERNKKIGTLWNLGYIEFPKRVDKTNYRVTFIDDDSDEEMFIDDFRELGYEYRKYCGENFIRCAECDILIKGNKNGTKKYCKECASYTPKKAKTIVCVDCGNTFSVAGNNKRQIRCCDCYTQYRKEKIRENVQKFRENNRM